MDENKSNSEKTNNKSFYLYAALIFLIAFIVVIISCFGQNKFSGNSMPEEAPPQNIQERTTLVSEENSRLVKENERLKSEMEKNIQQVNEIQNECRLVNESAYNNNLVVGCYVLYKKGDKKDARAQLELVKTEVLSEDAMELYNELSEKLAEKTKK